MKHIIILITFSVMHFTTVFAQVDTTVSFKVSGLCGMCKQRIEKAANLKGVESAKWSAADQLLTVKYNSGKATIDQLHQAVANAGHDTELKKANDEVYKNLPDCCLYRDLAIDETIADSTSQDAIKGIVMELNNGQENALRGASLVWAGTSKGTTTNNHGEFILEKSSSTDKLVISYTGFKNDTVSISGLSDIQIMLNRNDVLNTVTVSARQRTTYINSYDPFRTAVITKKELLKAACCNLSESFETNPSVDVSYNDAATGSKQIQLLGLAGNYTQLTVENLPGPRGIATPLGLNSIAGPWVESIQLIKGTGSVVNGFESIAGQINVELRKP
ncbi:MAG TPA: carboxypeptidase-like regulatory domain-containing protein, partial [Chitinophagaceae bacterium]